MQYNNTVRGYQAIVDGSTDLFFCAAPSREQQTYAEGQGAELVFVPIGLEAFVFFVNEHNPVQGTDDRSAAGDLCRRVHQLGRGRRAGQGDQPGHPDGGQRQPDCL